MTQDDAKNLLRDKSCLLVGSDSELSFSPVVLPSHDTRRAKNPVGLKTTHYECVLVHPFGLLMDIMNGEPWQVTERPVFGDSLPIKSPNR
jgi:hypothetical protein